MNRRDFLDARHLAQTIGQTCGALLPDIDDAAPGPPEAVALVHFSRRAMATTFEATFPLGTEAAWELSGAALDEVDRLEAQLTVYRDDSQVSSLNRRAFAEALQVAPSLFDLLALSARIHRETEGAFDPSAGALIKAWGFFRGPRKVPSHQARREACQRAGFHHVLLNEAEQTVRFTRPGLELNFGSVGKGFALDRAAQLVRQRQPFVSALLRGGRSSILALGKLPGNVRGWPVAIDHPWHKESQLAVVYLDNQALGTSAATFQHLEWQGRKLGHILDPRTGWPAEKLASATVIAPTAAEADALATAFFILGIDKARAYCEAHPGIGAILLANEPAVQPVVLGLPPGTFTLGSLA